MPMSAEVLGPLLKGNIDALTDEQKKDRSAVFEAMAAAIITHIQSAGIVNVTVVGTATGVTSGGASAPVAGTGTGTVT